MPRPYKSTAAWLVALAATASVTKSHLFPSEKIGPQVDPALVITAQKAAEIIREDLERTDSLSHQGKLDSTLRIPHARALMDSMMEPFRKAGTSLSLGTYQENGQALKPYNTCVFISTNDLNTGRPIDIHACSFNAHRQGKGVKNNVSVSFE